jgi:DNA-binding transcriptional regulator YiaG
MKETILLHHPLADVRIKPIAHRQAKKLKQIINSALNEYLEETTIAVSVLHSETKLRHGKAYGTPGYYLRLYRLRSNLTQKELARRLRIMQHHLSEMEHNKRPIGKALAKKLSEELNCDYHEFL